MLTKLVADKADSRAYRVYVILAGADSLHDIRHYKGMHLEALNGQWKGYYSLRINAKWRLTFRINPETNRYADVNITPHEY